jgi:hypothetical protein
MAKRNRPPSSGYQVADIVAQQARIKQAFPGFAWTWKAGLATWTGELQPTENSGRYLIRITYRVGAIPKVIVLSPKLKAGCPHLYGDGSLCLYWPKEWHWTRSAVIAETILPWAANWLYFYELWLDTDEWLGPSSHAQVPKDPDKVDAA